MKPAKPDHREALLRAIPADDLRSIWSNATGKHDTMLAVDLHYAVLRRWRECADGVRRWCDATIYGDESP
jgi:hypothetical protein